jgi:hypothetical protein
MSKIGGVAYLKPLELRIFGRGIRMFGRKLIRKEKGEAW